MPRRPEQFEDMREKSREKILAAALELFGHRGYSATSIDSIAKKAGISKGLIYNYYPGKREILVAIFEQAINDGIQMVSPHLPEPDPYVRMRKIIEEVFNMLITRTNYLKLFMSMAVQPGVMDDTKAVSEKILEINGQFVSALNRDAGILSETDALMLDALLDGVFVSYIRYGAKYPLETVKQQIITTYCMPKKAKAK